MRNLPILGVTLLILGMVAPASAQQGSPEMQALQSKLLQEFNGGLVCTAEKIAVQDKLATAERDLAAAQKELKDMRAADQPKQ